MKEGSFVNCLAPEHVIEAVFLVNVMHFIRKMKTKSPSVIAYLWFVRCDALDSDSSFA